MSDWFREDFVLLQGDTLRSLYSVDFFVRNPQVSVSLDLEKQNDATEYSPFGSTVLVVTAVTLWTIKPLGWEFPPVYDAGYRGVVDFHTLRADISAGSCNYAGDRISSVLGTLSR